MIRFTCLLALLLFSSQIDDGRGHGRLMNPPARNSMWRLGFPNPINLNDAAVWCGGVRVQFSKEVDGKCGVCGDPWLDPRPRRHENGGYYGNGIIGRRYQVGQYIDIEVELMVNHYGTFEIRLCPLDDPKQLETQECFDWYPLLIEGTSSYRFHIPPDSKERETFKYRVKLPDGVTCQRCVIRWSHNGAHFRGLCPNGTEAVGCGPQENYYNCADVTIGTDPVPPPKSPIPTKTDVKSSVQLPSKIGGLKLTKG